MSSSKTRLVFMGTPEFAVAALKALIAAGNNIICVYTQPPKPAGRGQEVKKSPVHLAAEAADIPVRTPKSLKVAEEQQAFHELNADIAVVAAYGLILPKPVLEAPKFGCINIHGSILPRWRGAAPIHRALLAGDKESGITIMQMDEGLDTGAMLMVKSLSIQANATAQTLHDALRDMGAEMIVQAVKDLPGGKLKAAPQPAEGATYAQRLSREEGRVDWKEEAEVLARKVRALNPWPGVFFESKGGRIKILEARVEKKSDAPGTLLDDQFTVACGKDALVLTRVQREGRGPMEGTAFLRGFAVKPGEAL